MVGARVPRLTQAKGHQRTAPIDRFNRSEQRRRRAVTAEGVSVHIMTGFHGASLEDYIASELPADADVIASICRFAAVLAGRIRRRYPGTSVEVRCDLDVTGSLPWDGNTYILDPLPGIVAGEVVREIDALRGAITNAEWVVWLTTASDAADLHAGTVIDHHALSLG